MGKNMGSQFAKFEITPLGVPKLKKKQYPEMANYLTHFAGA
jgi:hypothetical protein